jgi:hypothetical protein
LVPLHEGEPYEDTEVKIHTFLTFALNEGKWSASFVHINDHTPAYTQQIVAAKDASQ